MKRFRVNGLGLSCIGLSLLISAPVRAVDENDQSRPAFKTLRFDEDWSAFKAIEGQGHPLDALKHIDLNDDGSAWLSLGGQVRVRVEDWSAFGFNDANDDTFVLLRLFMHADLHVNENIRVFVQGKSNHATDRDLPGGKRAALDVDTADLLDAFVDLKLHPDDGTHLTLRGGRQELLFGKQRLISPLDWSNNRRTFDGFRAILRSDDSNHALDAFLTHPVQAKKYEFNDANDNQIFWGLYDQITLEHDHIDQADLYLLGLHRRGATFGGVTANEDRLTLGGRVHGPVGDAWAYDLEAAMQFGDFGTQDIHAWMISGDLEIPLDAESDMKPKAVVGFDYASGDDSTTDGDLGTFNQLFPLGHAYLGYVDVVGRQNVIDVRGSISAWPVPGEFMVKADVHRFWRAEENDALYNAGGGVVRAGGPGTSSDVGWEIDLTGKWILDAHTNVQIGYSHFFAGDFLADTGTSDDIDFVYGQFQYTF